jgi:beta-glucanase (GH16 family)
MEHGLNTVNEVSSAIHTPSSFGNTMNTAILMLDNVAENYHVYSMNWSPDQITFMIDGVGFYTYSPATQNDATWPFYLEQYLILNIAMGGIAGPIAPGFSESSMEIDYVRVYQNDPLNTTDTFADSFTVYPNPASDFIAIKTNKNIGSVALYTSLGQLVLTKNNPKKQNDIRYIKSGLYLLKIYSEHTTITKKLIINKK